MNSFLAVDIGASSGRIILGILNDGILKYQEIHRFKNQMIHEEGHDRWDVERLFEAICCGLEENSSQLSEVASIGIDTWGVDFVLLPRTW